MKRGFTLLELLIVVAVMVTLMAIMFRMSSVARSASRRTETISRLQKLENCLSGYYSAFGSYPPVSLHGSRDIYCDVEHGVQTDNRTETLSWSRVRAACESQPVACAFPFEADDKMRDFIEAVSAEIQMRAGEGYYDNKASYNFSTCTRDYFTSEKWSEREWTQVQIFKFGLMSYLLPRYLTMMNAAGDFYGNGYTACAQWTDNNDSSPSSATDGASMDYGQIWENVQRDDSGNPRRGMQDYIKVANMPTQAVCGRWIPNLSGLCVSWTDITLFGVRVTGGSTGEAAARHAEDNPGSLEIYTADKGGNYYILNYITVLDGWSQPFYYYSPVGNQSYVLWSGGENGKTFPPWIAREKLSANDRKTVAEWTEDDIMRMRQ